jgi:hypothetical protein
MRVAPGRRHLDAAERLLRVVVVGVVFQFRAVDHRMIPRPQGGVVGIDRRRRRGPSLKAHVDPFLPDDVFR